MFWEFFHIVAEEANRRAHVAPIGGQVTLRQQIIFNSIFSRVIISVPALWLLGTGIIIRVEAFFVLPAIGVVANAGLITFSLVTFYALWRYPHLVPRILPRLSILLIVCSVIVFVSLMNPLPHTKEYVLRPEFLWSFIFLVPSTVIFSICALAGRQAIYLSNYADQFLDEIPGGENDEPTLRLENN
jgi:hypothetical protein